MKPPYFDSLPNANMRLSDPKILLATWFGSGLVRPASGTWGTLATIPLAYPLWIYTGPIGLIIAAIFLLLIGLWAARGYEEQSGQHDSGRIVIDESCGFCIALAGAPMGIEWFMAAFLLFRLFDVVKVGPVGWIDQHLGGAEGVMLDDVMAGIMTASVIVAVNVWMI